MSARRRGRTYDEWGIDAGPGAAEDRRPENPDRRMVVDMLASTYKREAIPMVIETAIAALGERSPDELIAAGEARRVYDWAVGPAEGIMG